MEEFFAALRRLFAWLAAIALGAVALVLLVRFLLEPLADLLLASPGGVFLLALVLFWFVRRRGKWRS